MMNNSIGDRERGDDGNLDDQVVGGGVNTVGCYDS